MQEIILDRSKKIGRNLEAALKIRRVKKGEFAKLIQVDPSTVSRWINGKLLIGDEQLQKASQILHLPPEIFLVGFADFPHLSNLLEDDPAGFSVRLPDFPGYEGLKKITEFWPEQPMSSAECLQSLSTCLGQMQTCPDPEMRWKLWQVCLDWVKNSEGAMLREGRIRQPKC